MKRIILTCILLVPTIFGSFGLITQKPSWVRIATYSTSLQGRTLSQKHNSILAAQKLDGVVIPPGKVFSFNKTVGTWSRYEGYRKAPVSYNGQMIKAWGGGVCQTSTTLYNTALLAGLEIIERNQHRFAPEYVPPGRDAAVAFENIDLRFKNPYPFPILIKNRTTNERLQFEILGKKPLNCKIQIVHEIHKVNVPKEFSLQSSSFVSRTAHPGNPGFAVTVYRVFQSDRGIRKELVSRNSYPSAPRITFSSR
ncbi:MAG TPA: VanW family protein [Fimbriimonadales bacterium]|nr:VanW family protein [Fimbriimonadales bacterium]